MQRAGQRAVTRSPVTRAARGQRDGQRESSAKRKTGSGQAARSSLSNRRKAPTHRHKKPAQITARKAAVNPSLLRYGAVKIDTTRPTQVPGLVSRGSSWVSINCAFEDFPFDDFVDFVASVDDAVSETMASKVDASAERKDDDLNEDDFL